MNDFGILWRKARGKPSFLLPRWDLCVLSCSFAANATAGFRFMNGDAAMRAALFKNRRATFER
jgi:hypothetical protein